MQSCALSLSSHFVSTAHAIIKWDGRGWSVRDLGSKNGTYVNETVVPAGEAVVLRRGARIAFGGAGETWVLEDASGPAAAVIPLDGGEPILLRQPITGLPSADEPLASVYLDGEQWFLEREDARVPLQSGATFMVAEREFRFECPSAAPETMASVPDECDLDGSTLVLSVSLNEEEVSLTLKRDDGLKDLGQRACFYLMLVLARQRISVPATGLDDSGWVSIAELLRMIPDYSSSVHLNVEIFRLRRLLADAGVRDAARIIERRRGQIRLGSDRVEIRRAPAEILREVGHG